MEVRVHFTFLGAFFYETSKITGHQKKQQISGQKSEPSTVNHGKQQGNPGRWDIFR
jgi:hypothetical protein